MADFDIDFDEENDSVDEAVGESQLLQVEKRVSAGHVYLPSKSSSFKLISDKSVLQNFLDGEAFTGRDVEDVVKVGSLRARSRFCCMTKTVGRAFKRPGIQGILGLAFVNFTASPSLLKTFLQRSRPEWQIDNRNAAMKAMHLTVISGKTRGELQFGGLDPASVTGPPIITPMYLNKKPHTNPGYMAKLVSVLHNGNALLMDMGMVSVTFDTGSSCAVLPFELSKAIDRLKQSDMLSLVFEQHASVNLTKTQFGCYIGAANSGTVLLGASFFQAFAVEFRVDISLKMSIRMFQINPQYEFEQNPNAHWLPAHISSSMLAGTVASKPSKLGFDVVGSTSFGKFFAVPIELGSHEVQHLRVLVDTGSAMLAVKCDRDDKELNNKANRPTAHTRTVVTARHGGVGPHSSSSSQGLHSSSSSQSATSVEHRQADGS